MKVIKSCAVTGDPHDKSVLMQVSEREYRLLVSLIGFTTGGGYLDVLTLQMYKDMKGIGNYIPNTLKSGHHEIPLNVGAVPAYSELQHEGDFQP